VEQAATVCLQYEFVSYRKLEYIISLYNDPKFLSEQENETSIVLNHENIRGKTIINNQKSKNMNQQSTLTIIRSLRLTGMADHFEAVLAMPIHQQPDAEILLTQLLEAEQMYRNHRRLLTAVKKC